MVTIMRLLLPNKYEWITQVSHWHTQKFCYRGKLGQRSKKRAFINANHIHSITKGMNLKSADELWVTIISIMCQNQLKLCPSLFVTLKISSFQKQRLTALTHVFQRCACIPSFSTSLSITPPMWISPVTLSDTSLWRSVTCIFSSHVPSA